MILVQQEMMQCLVFCDIPVTKMEFMREDKVLKIFIKSAFIEHNKNSYFGIRTDMILGEGVLVFKNWSDIKVVLDTQPGKKLVNLDEWKFDPLEDILIFDQIENRIEISGFGIRDGFWEKWTIVDSQYYGEFEEYERE